MKEVVEGRVRGEEDALTCIYPGKMQSFSRANVESDVISTISDCYWYYCAVVGSGNGGNSGNSDSSGALVTGTGILVLVLLLVLVLPLPLLPLLQAGRIKIFSRSGKYHMLPTGELLVFSVTSADAHSSYRCRTVHHVTADTVESSSYARLVVTVPLDIVVNCLRTVKNLPNQAAFDDLITESTRTSSLRHFGSVPWH
ncbi:cell adhesion molecule Dscam2-like isoform X1 [Vespula maculifrons]|uniref:Cell adhesion molecule Dscam2-like isoform X1 n=1 Tax=Vespula maculifrons TaxID=7453 RepID=A0ABD2BFQ0_VESMC